jgi:transglutaminase-like putative cysteine protease
MTILTIRHVTRYRYREPVAFGEHRMMFRPRESYDQRVLDSRLVITPRPSELRFVHDVFGNCVGIARFSGRARELVFESVNRLEHLPDEAVTELTLPYRALNSYPYAYSAEELPDLSSSIQRQFADPDRVLEDWSRRFLRGSGPFDAPTVLSAMTHAIHDELVYVRRVTGHPQTPVETLTSRQGSCRDFAVLLMEAARTLGLAARFVSGYLHNPAKDGVVGRHVGGGNTHAWVRTYLPSGGWVEFDPTNGLVGNRDLIRVAVVRDSQQAVPLSGTWLGDASDFIGMDVEVNVTAQPEPEESRKRA